MRASLAERDARERRHACSQHVSWIICSRTVAREVVGLCGLRSMRTFNIIVPFSPTLRHACLQHTLTLTRLFRYYDCGGARAFNIMVFHRLVLIYSLYSVVACMPSIS